MGEKTMSSIAGEDAIRTTIYLTITNKRWMENNHINMSRFFNNYVTDYRTSERNEDKLQKELNEYQERVIEIQSILHDMKQERKQ